MRSAAVCWAGCDCTICTVSCGGFCLSILTTALEQPRTQKAIAPYRYQGTWVFDDPAVGLSREPFIAGIDTMIDKAVADIPNAEKGFRAIFSGSPFPGANWKLEWRRAESGGNWYYSDQFKME